MSTAILFGPVFDLSKATNSILMEKEHKDMHLEYVIMDDAISNATDDVNDHPHTMVLSPVYDSLGQQGNIVAFTSSIMAFDRYMGNLLPNGVRKIRVVVKSTCNQAYSYDILGSKVRETNGSVHLSRKMLHGIDFVVLF